MLGKSTIITGNVTNEKNESVSQAIIYVTEIDKNNNTTTDLGFTVSDINGKYEFIIEAYEDMFYEFTIFPPLKN